MIAASCTPAPKYCARKDESPRTLESAAHAARDATVLALRLGPPVKRYAPNRVTSPFGPRDNLRRSGKDYHDGVDIKAASAEEVIAAAAGTVAFSGKQGGYGNVVRIDHGSGVTSVYAHLFYASVRKGERVGKGQLVGRAGKRGNATGTHVHFEIRVDGRPIDPLPHLWLDSDAR
jgi:murein DD-endopeptidase MepM/ murein hydrolase activator NlpD